jgi:hypothetical protein
MNRSRHRVPDGIEPISAYRAWSYVMQGSRAKLFPLGSFAGLTAPSPWDGAETGWVVATCSMADDDPAGVPDEGCTCGFYAVKTLPMLLRMFGQHWDPSFEFEAVLGSILGRIELAGKIIEHDRGYRAERARIAELIPCEGQQESAGRLASLLALHLGDPVPSNLLLPPPDPPPPRLPPSDGPSPLRLRVRDWVRDAAA